MKGMLSDCHQASRCKAGATCLTDSCNACKKILNGHKIHVCINASISICVQTSKSLAGAASSAAEPDAPAYKLNLTVSCSLKHRWISFDKSVQLSCSLKHRCTYVCIYVCVYVCTLQLSTEACHDILVTSQSAVKTKGGSRLGTKICSTMEV